MAAGLRGLGRLTCVCVFQSDLSTPIRVSLIVVPDIDSSIYIFVVVSNSFLYLPFSLAISIDFSVFHFAHPYI